MIKLYVDMDGVLTNFDSQVQALGPDASVGLMPNATEEQKLVMYKAIDAAGETFWADMPWTEDGRRLWAFCKEHKPILLSSPGKFLYAPSGKKTWVNENLPGTTLFLSNDKYQYAEPSAILIDDNEGNIGAWKEAGGMGILHTGADNSIRLLQEILEKPYMRAIADYVRRLAVFIQKDYEKSVRQSYLAPPINGDADKFMTQYSKDMKRKYLDFLRTSPNMAYELRNAIQDGTSGSVGINDEGDLVKLK
jgi:hypothetical protein